MPRRYSIIAGVASMKPDGPFVLHREVEETLQRRESKIETLKKQINERDRKLLKSSKGVVQISIKSTNGKTYEITLDGTLTINGLNL
jgi:hypothetical protein